MYALDGTRVLRRYKTRPVPEDEVAVMRFARDKGYPVPEVFSVRGREMVMARVDGPTMQDVLEADPGQLDRQIGVLAALHERLHAITIPPGVVPSLGGDTLLHMDLHPKNVLIAGDGPWVIDWANARSGHWADDVAQTIVVVWSALGDPTFADRAVLVHHFVESFVAHFDRDAVRAHLPAAIERRVADRNVTDRERAAVREARL